MPMLQTPLPQGVAGDGPISRGLSGLLSPLNNNGDYRLPADAFSAAAMRNSSAADEPLAALVTPVYPSGGTLEMGTAATGGGGGTLGGERGGVAASVAGVGELAAEAAAEPTETAAAAESLFALSRSQSGPTAEDTGSSSSNTLATQAKRTTSDNSSGPVAKRGKGGKGKRL